jgi:limonene-1,2-epoxide hydrolase
MGGRNPEEVVLSFCSEWERGDIGAVLDYFTEDAVYHNIPVEPVSGRDAIKATIDGFMNGVDKVEFRVGNVAAKGGVVMTERVDVFHTARATIELPVMGTFEVRDSKIAAWRDYFDLNQFMSQLPAASG